jgi:pimeloyl-ACP methyl ester carboxylesterase
MSSCSLQGTEALCGTLRVPEDPTNPAGRAIDLRVAVIPAVDATPKSDPVFWLSGGPGGAATEDFAWTSAAFSMLHADRDFVLADQRGTGDSHRLVAPTQPDTSGQSDDEAAATIKAWVAATLAQMDGDPRFYTTSVAMDDLDLVRAALGYDKINLYGASYGATAAQYYLRQHEGRVQAVVVDGATLLDVPVFERMAASTQRALDLLFDRCKASVACADAYPDIRAEFTTVLERVTTAPLATGVADPRTSRPVVMDRSTFAGAVHLLLMEAHAAAALPSQIHAAYRGDFDRLAQAAANAMGQDTGQLVMSTVIRCSEAWARYDPDVVARLGQGTFEGELQTEMARSQATACGFIPKAVVPANDAEPVRSDVPVLLLVGEADPQDPPQNVADAAVELPKSVTVVVPGQGHTVGHIGCMPSLVTAFIQAGTVAGLDLRCASSIGIPAFVTYP